MRISGRMRKKVATPLRRAIVRQYLKNFGYRGEQAKRFIDLWIYSLTLTDADSTIEALRFSRVVDIFISHDGKFGGPIVVKRKLFAVGLFAKTDSARKIAVATTLAVRPDVSDISLESRQDKE